MWLYQGDKAERDERVERRRVEHEQLEMEKLRLTAEVERLKQEADVRNAETDLERLGLNGWMAPYKQTWMQIAQIRVTGGMEMHPDRNFQNFKKWETQSMQTWIGLKPL